MKKYLLTLTALACTLFATAQTPAFLEPRDMVVM